MSANIQDGAPYWLELTEDDPDILQKYRPFILNKTTDDWVNSLELEPCETWLSRISRPQERDSELWFSTAVFGEDHIPD